jgi:putative transcriptional regulator
LNNMAKHEIKPGKVLIAQKFWENELLHRSVILILEHDETGSTGIILNKAKFIAQTVPFYNASEALLYGGTFDSHRLGFIHQIKNLARTIKISDDIYYSENCLQLQKKISEGELNTRQVKAFMGFTVWNEGQLEKEMIEKKWWIDNFKMSELQEVESDKLWEYKLMKKGNLYGLFGSMNDPGLN